MIDIQLCEICGGKGAGRSGVNMSALQLTTPCTIIESNSTIAMTVGGVRVIILVASFSQSL